MILVSMVILIVAIFAGILWYTREQVMKFGIEKLRELLEQRLPELLGDSPVELGRIDISLGYKCSVGLNDITIGNMAGFKSDHLLKLGKLKLEADVGSAVKSVMQNRGPPKQIEVTQVELDTVHIIYEKSLTTSNVESLLGVFVDKDGKKPAEKKKEETTSEEKQDAAGPQVNVRKTDIKGIQLELATTLGAGVGVPGAVVAVAPISYPDFTKEFGSRGALVVMKVLIETILVSALKNTQNFGKGTENVAKAVHEQTKQVGDAMKEHAESLGKAADSLNVSGLAGKAEETTKRMEEEASKAMQQAKDVQKAAEDAQKKAANAIGSLFGGGS
mmetsp:Transcript_35924/g.86485  ORF Transcript_35924/g.86485 Transcript_35924/m.86485 type:complete len:331 (-) Transcript_35924:253-1245(-)